MEQHPDLLLLFLFHRVRRLDQRPAQRLEQQVEQPHEPQLDLEYSVVVLLLEMVYCAGGVTLFHRLRFVHQSPRLGIGSLTCLNLVWLDEGVYFFMLVPKNGKCWTLHVRDQFEYHHVSAISGIHGFLQIVPTDGFSREIIEQEGKLALAQGWDATDKGGFFADEPGGK